MLRVAVVGAETRAGVMAWLASLPDAVGFAVVLVSLLSVDEVRAATRLPVIAAVDGAALERGTIYVAPADREVRFARRRLALGGVASAGAGFDVALRAAADELGRASIGIVLAGHGVSGALGIRRIKEAGGWTLAQEVDGDTGEMPRAAIATGCVDLVLPVADLVPRLMASIAHDAGNASPADTRVPDTAADALREILSLVRIRSGHDFSSYKRGTLYRRITQRMAMCACATIVDYHGRLRDQPSELACLLREFFIGVTQFFRDPAVFDVLAREVIPRLFTNRSAEDEIRIWVAGCATGEEVYSLGILLLEHAARVGASPSIQIFATDIDERALAVARAGRYSPAIAVDVTPARLERFFSDDDGHFRVCKDLRDLVLFSPHNLLRDPPFSRLDLISCRNLLMYLERDAQNLALSRFHFALQPDGMLVLGTSESAEDSPAFAAVDSKHQLFVRRSSPRAAVAPVGVASGSQPVRVPSLGAPPERTVPLSELHYRLLEQYAPPSMLVNGDLDVLHLSEHAGRFLGVSGGEPTRQLLRLVHPALRVELRAAIYAARHAGSDVRAVHFHDSNGAREVEIGVRRVELAELGRGAVLVTLAELEPQAGMPASTADALTIEPVVREIEDELHRTREQLRAVVLQYEASLEELKASNEELQAANEELRSAAEEIESSKEEMQAVNEELTTVNHELSAKVEEVGHANADLQNLMTSTEIAVVFLGRQLEIKRFTPKAQGIFNVIASDIGRPLAHLTHRLDCSDLCDTARSVLHTLHTVERELCGLDGRRYLTRWLPYRSLEDRIDGVVLTLVDVTDLQNAIAARQRSEETLRLIEERLHIALRSAPIAILGFDAVASSPGEPAGAAWGFVMGRELDLQQRTALSLFASGHGDRLRASVRQAVDTGAGQRTELDLVIDDELRTFDFRVEPSVSGATAVGFDITPSKAAEASLRDADRRKDEFLATLSHELRNPLAPLQVALDVARLVDDDPEQRARSLGIMERQVGMLVTLVDELLDLSRITQGKIVLERAPISLAHVLESALIATRPLLDGARHEFRIDLPDRQLEIDGDFRRLVQVFTNLLTNAAKYTPPGGHIAVTVIPGTANVAVRVQDDGVGIAPDMLTHIFEIFVQSRDARGRSQGGLGIGLNLVRRVVELHGGTVSARSDGAGSGSVFTVELPLRRGAA